MVSFGRMSRILILVSFLCVLVEKTSSAGYCGDGLCSGSEQGAWCSQDCKCGDGLCDVREKVLQLCPSECSTQLLMAAQPPSSTTAGVPFTASTQVWDGAGAVAESSASVSAELLTGAGGPTNVPLAGTTGAMSECGMARFTNLAVGVKGNYTFRFNVVIGGTLMTTVSSPFAITAGRMHHLTMSVQPRGFRPGFAFKQQPITEVRDVADNLISSGADSTTEITASLWAGQPDPVLDVDPDFLKRQCFQGVAKFTNIKVKQRASGVSILFSAGPLILPVRTAFFVVADVPSALYILRAPKGGKVGVAFADQPSLQASDAFGNAATWYEGDGIVIAAQLNAPPLVNAALLGVKVQQADDGRVTFSELSIDRSGSNFSMTFTATVGVTEGYKLENTSKPFDINFGLPYKLFVKTGTNPAGAVPGSILVQQPTVLVQDILGNIVSDDAGKVTITASLLEGGQPTSKPLMGVLTKISCTIDPATSTCVPCSSGACGVAEWPSTVTAGLGVNTVGLEYQIIFSSPGLLPAISYPAFNVAYGQITKLRVTTEPFGFRLGVPFKGQPVVELLDKAYNLVPASDSRVVAELVVDDECCFRPSISQETKDGYAFFSGYGIDVVPTALGVKQLLPIFKLRFTSASILSPFSVDTKPFLLATDPVRLTITRQPSAAAPGQILGVQPKVTVEDINGTTAGWFADRPVRVTATICVAIDNIFGSYDEQGASSGDPRFKCHDARDDFCAIQQQTPLLMRPVAIPKPRMEVMGSLVEDAQNGIVSFTNIRLDKWGTYKLRFDSPGYSPVFSDPFSVLTSSAVRLFVLVQPGGAIPGQAMTSQPTVLMHDLGGNVVTAASGQELRASLLLPGDMPASTVVKLQTANDDTMLPVATMRFGSCAFQGLRVDTAGTYILHFEGGDVLPTDSMPFTVAAAAPTKLSIVAGPEGCRFGFACTSQPVVEVVDAGGNRADSSTVMTITWKPVSSGLCPREQALNAFTAVKGLFTLAGIGLSYAAGAGSCDGLYTFEVSTESGLASAVWPNVIISGDPTALAVDVSPESAFPGIPWLIQVRGLLVDAQGRKVSSASAAVAAEVLDCGGGGGCVSSSSGLVGTTSVTSVFGTVQFTDLRLDTEKTCYRVRLSSAPLTSTLTFAFDVQPSTFLAFVGVMTEPSDATAGLPITRQPVVSAMDRGANIMTSYKQSVAAVLLTGDQELEGLLGRRSVTFAGGVASFTNLQVNRASCCLRLMFTVASGLFRGFSQGFCVFPNTPTRLSLSLPPAVAVPGWPFAVQPVLGMQDDFQNVVVGSTCRKSCELLSASVSAILEQGSGSAEGLVLLLGETQINFVGGVAKFSSLQIDTAGSHSLGFATVPPSLLLPLSGLAVTVVPAIDRATKLTIIRQPYGFAGTVVGKYISIQPIIGIADVGSNVISRASTLVTVSLLNSTQGSWLRGTTTVSTVNGVASFTDLHLGPSPDGPGLKLKLRFTTALGCTSGHDKCTPIDSVGFDIAGAVWGMEVLDQPGGAVAGASFNFQPSLTIYDASGRLYTYFQVAKDVLYVTLVNDTMVNGTNMTLFGNRSAIYSDARATWTDLRIDKVGVYVLRFFLPATTGELFHIDSARVTVLPANATNLTILTQPAFPYPGLPFGITPNISVIDEFGNVVPSWDVAIKASLLQHGEASAAPLLGKSAVLPANGIAAFASLGLARSGDNWQVAFSSPGLQGVTSEAMNLSTSGNLSNLTVSVEPGGIFDGLTFLVQPKLQLLDLGGNLILNGNILNVTVSLHGERARDLNLSSASGAALTSRPSGGEVKFTDLRISGWGGENANLFLNFTHNRSYAGVNGSVLFDVHSVLSRPIRVTQNVTSLAATRNVSHSNTGGSVFAAQPIIAMLDAKGMVVENNWAGATAITATLLATGPGTCPSSTPFRCTGSGTACALSSSFCPTLSGTKIALVTNGVAKFSGLAINVCNDASSPSCITAICQIRFTATASSPYKVMDPLPFVSPAILISTGNPSAVVFSIQPRFPAAGQPFGQQPSIRVTDAGGNEVPSFEGTIQIVLINPFAIVCCITCSCKAETFGAVKIMSAGGRATAVGLGIMTKGTFKIRMTTGEDTAVPGLYADSEPVVVTVGSPHSIMIGQQPGPSTTGGTAFGAAFQTGVQPWLAAIDKGGNIVTTFTGTVTAELQAEGKPATGSGTTTLSFVYGVATYTDLTVNLAGACYTFLFTSVPSLVPATSNPFSVVIGPSFRITILRQPSGFRPGHPFDVQPIVLVQDQGFNTVPSAIDLISASLQNEDPSLATNKLCSFTPLYCETSTKAVGGVARFSGLRVDNAGTGYFITFERLSGGFQPAVSDKFSVDVGPGMQLTMTRQPEVAQTDRGQPGLVLATQPKVVLQDAGGNVVTLRNSFVTASLWYRGVVSSDISIPIFEKPLVLHPPTSTNKALIQQDLVRPQSLSQYTYTDLQIDRAGTGYTVRFSAGPNVLWTESAPLDILLGKADRVVVLRNPSGTLAGIPFTVQPVAALQDRGGNTRKADSLPYPMIVTLELPDPSMQQKLQPISSQTAYIVDGVAVFSGLFVNAPAIGVKLKFSSGALITASSSPFIVSSPATNIDVEIQPEGSFASELLKQQPAVRLEDEGGRLVDMQESLLPRVVTASISPESNPLKSVVSGTPVFCCWGICRFTDLRIPKAGQNYQLDMSSTGLLPVRTNPFVIQGPTLLSIVTQPKKANNAEPLQEQPVIQVTDAKGLLMQMCNENFCHIGGSAVVTASLSGVGAVLGSTTGTTTATIIAGVATFTDLGIQGGGRSLNEPPFVIRFSAPDLNSTFSEAIPLSYPMRALSNYVETTVQISPMTLEEFTPSLQVILINTLASQSKLDSKSISIMSIEDSTGNRRAGDWDVMNQTGETWGKMEIVSKKQAIMRTKISGATTPSSMTGGAIEPVGNWSTRKLLGVGTNRKLLEVRSIDVTIRFFPDSPEQLYDVQESLEAFLKRDGAFAASLEQNGFPKVTSKLIRVPTGFAADGSAFGTRPPPGLDYSAIAGGTSAFVIVLFGFAMCWWRRQRRRKTMKLNKVDQEVMWSIGIEHPQEHNYVDDALPWTAAKMLQDDADRGDNYNK